MAEHIHDRIRNAFGPDDEELPYHVLIRRVFPPDQYPNAWRSANKGGPPGCARAFGAALYRMGMKEFYVNEEARRSGARGYFLRPKQEPTND